MERPRRTEERQLIADRYELGGELGRGATGTVWEAWDRRTDRAVAIKILHRHLLTSVLTRRRFLREVELASTLRHPHCVEVLAHGDDGQERVYLVMERLCGTTLANRLREAGPLSQQHAVKIVAQILDAVGAAHAVQIVHRDLKPANVMLIERDGDEVVVKVCDFGLAKAIVIEPSSRDDPNGELVEIGSLSTNQGEICGTPEYMAPEQARGEIIDGRADLYSVGVILYQAVVGRPPFQSRSPLAVVSMHLAAPPPRPSELRPDLRIYPPLENLILRALSKERAERPSSAEVFRADLLQIARDHARRERERDARGAVSGKAVRDRTPVTVSDGAPPRRISLMKIGAVVLTLAVASFAGRHLHSRIGRPVGPAMATAGRDSARLPSPPPLLPTLPRFATRNQPAATTETLPVSESVARDERPPAARPAPWVRPRVRENPRRDDSQEMVRAAEERLGTGQIAEACALGQTAAEVHPKSPAAWAFLGRCRMRRGEGEMARAAFRRYLELAPRAPDATFVRAILDEGQ